MAALTAALVGGVMGLAGAKMSANAQKQAARRQERAMREQEQRALTIDKNKAALGGVKDGTQARIKLGADYAEQSQDVGSAAKGRSPRKAALPGATNALWGGL